MTTDQDLVGLLEAAGRVMDTPDTDLAPAVLARLEAGDTTSRPRPVRARLVAVVVLVLLLVGAAIAADLVPGLHVVSPGRPPSDAAPITSAADLGRSATLDEAARAAGLAGVQMPSVSSLASPEVRVDGRLVHLAWPASSELPELGGSGIGLLLTQWSAGPDDQVLVKAVPGDGLQAVDVGDVSGWWITGPHEVVPVGDEATGRWRRADDVLVWHRDGTTFRLESRLPMDDVLEIARSIG